MARLKVLAIAVATGRIGYVFLHGGELIDWKMSKAANRSSEAARSYTERLIAYFKPDVVVTEKLANQSRKGDHAKSIIAAIAGVAEKAKLLDVQVLRPNTFKNKYEEMAALGYRFPIIRYHIPRRPRLWESEPRSTIWFEALSLATVVIDEPQPA